MEYKYTLVDLAILRHVKATGQLPLKWPGEPPTDPSGVSLGELLEHFIEEGHLICVNDADPPDGRYALSKRADEAVRTAGLKLAK